MLKTSILISVLAKMRYRTCRNTGERGHRLKTTQRTNKRNGFMGNFLLTAGPAVWLRVRDNASTQIASVITPPAGCRPFLRPPPGRERWNVLTNVDVKKVIADDEKLLGTSTST